MHPIPISAIIRCGGPSSQLFDGGVRYDSRARMDYIPRLIAFPMIDARVQEHVVGGVYLAQARELRGNVCGSPRRVSEVLTLFKAKWQSHPGDTDEPLDESV